MPSNHMPSHNKKTTAFQKLCAFIPRHVSNRVVVNVLNIMRMGQRLFKKNNTGHLAENETTFLKHLDMIAKNKGYVEDQNSYTDMAYGKATMQYSGCEIFATYNAVYALTGQVFMSLPQMIAEYERDGMVLSGKFGTAPKAIRDFLQRHGFRTEFSMKEQDFDDLAMRNESLILTMYNDRDDIRKEVHTVSISKEKNRYYAHNVYCNGIVVGPCDTVSALMAQMNHGKVKGISLIGISQNP